MTRQFALIPLCATLMLLAACGEQQTAEAPNEYDVGPAQVPATTEAPVAAETAPAEVGEPLVIRVPSVEGLQETVAQAAEQVADAANQVRDAAAGQISAIAQSQPAADTAATAGGLVQGVASAITSQLNAPVPSQPADVIASAVHWQSTYAAEVPFYNLSDEPVTAYSQAAGMGDIIGTVEPGGGGFIETCNATLDWCLIPFGEEGQSGWVDMMPFGGVAN
jgi:hypothetical protein